MALFDNWLIMAIAAPIIWALVNLIDAYFAKEVYKDEFDATIVSNLFHLLPWFLIPIFGFHFPGLKIASLAVLGGMLYSLSYFFYFRSLFKVGDTSLIQSIWNMSAIATPAFAFLFIDERLSSVQYLGIFVVLFGAMILSFNKSSKPNFIKIIRDMIFATLLFSIGTIIEERVYDQIGFKDGFFLFALGSFLIGVSFLVVRTLQAKTSHLLEQCKDFGGSFLAVELLALIAAMFYQRAISITPAVSFVAVIEIFMPVFILVESVFIYFFLKSFVSLREKVEMIHQEQITGWKFKTLAVGVMALGVYLVNG